MAPHTQESNKHAELSLWRLAQAEDYLRAGNNIQASEKGWGAAAQAIKAIAEERGWNHNSHTLIVDVAQQVAFEERQPELIEMFGLAQALHTNFYDDWLSSETISIYLDNVKRLLPELERIRGVAPPGFTPETRDQRNRLRRLTRGS